MIAWQQNQQHYLQAVFVGPRLEKIQGDNPMFAVEINPYRIYPKSRADQSKFTLAVAGK
jgi:hypothetical protein